jgi:hypothetical protein
MATPVPDSIPIVLGSIRSGVQASYGPLSFGRDSEGSLWTSDDGVRPIWRVLFDNL